MRSFRPTNSCRCCGSTSYHRLFTRDGAGVLRPNGTYKCSGCKLNFTQYSDWRGGALEPHDQVRMSDLPHALGQAWTGRASA